MLHMNFRSQWLVSNSNLKCKEVHSIGNILFKVCKYYLLKLRKVGSIVGFLVGDLVGLKVAQLAGNF